MKKEKITFDQLFQSVIYQQIKDKGVSDDKFKPILDVAEFQDRDMIKDYSIVAIKSYGGTRYSIPDIDASPMSIQIIVNTDDPQYWKRILTEIINDINGKWNSIYWLEDNNYEAVTYYYMPTLNLPMIVGNGNQVGESTRYIVNMSGTIYYTTNPNLAPVFKIKLFNDEMGKYEDLTYLLSSSFGYAKQTEAYQSNDKDVLENESRGLARSISGSCIFDKSCIPHQKIIKSFFNGEDKIWKIKCYLDEEDSDYSMYVESHIAELTYQYVLGNSISVLIKFIEGSD